MKLIKKLDGAISIFLCIVLTSMIVLSGLLIDGSRVRAGETQAQAAAENSMRSALASYDRMLKDLYGLFALSDGSTESINEEIEAYMNRTLMTELGLDKKNMGEKTYDYLKKIITNSGDNEEVKFFNIFDYGIGDLEGESLYNLAQTEVLGDQIIENMKYRAPRELSEGFLEKLGMFKEFGKQSGTMKKKVEVDKELDKIRSDREKLSDAIEYINNFSTFDGGGKIEKIYEDYVNAVARRAYFEIELQKEEEIGESAQESMRQMEPDLAVALRRVNAIRQQMSNLASSATEDNALGIADAMSALGQSLSAAKTSYMKVKSQYDRWKAIYETSKNRCATLKGEIKENNSLADEKKKTIKTLINSCQEKCSEAKGYIEKIIKKSQDINTKIKDIDENDLNDETGDFADQIRLDMANSAKMVSSAKLTKTKADVLKNEDALKSLETFIESTDEDSIKGTQIPEKLGKSRDSVTEVDVSSYVGDILEYNGIVKILKQYSGRCNFNAITYEVIKQTQADSKAADPRVDSQKIVNDNVKNKEDISDEKKSNPQKPEERDLVSKNSVLKKDYSQEDGEYVKTILKGYQNIINFSENGVFPQTALEYGSNELKGILNGADFNNKDENFSASGLGFLTKIGEILKDSMEGMRDSMYINEYAMGNFKNVLSEKTTSKLQPEKDLSGILKSKRKTLYDGEVEYILTGMRDQQENIYSIEAQILLVRFSLNTLAIYMDPQKVSQALLAAEAIAGVTVFGVPIVQTMILLGWSMAESVADVKLIMGGDKVPVYKVKGDWILDGTSALKNFANATAGEVGHAVVDFGESKVEDLTKATKEKIDRMVEEKIDISVNKVFTPLEQVINVGDTTIEDISGQVLKKIDTGIAESGSSTSSELHKTIITLANEEFNRLRSELEEKIKNISTKEASNLINSKKNSAKEAVSQGIAGLTSKLKEEVDNAAINGSDKLKEYIEKSFGDSNTNTLSKGGSIKASMTAMGYQDYLRLFLLMRGNNSKLSRIADLIQLNMRLESGNNDFMLEDCNTYIRLKATVSMSYLFMTSALLPKESRFNNDSRHRINLLIYQGY